MGCAFQDQLELAHEVFLEFTQEAVGHHSGAAVHAVLKRERPRWPGRSGHLACVEASELFMALAQESVGHPSLHAALKGDGPCFPGRT